MFRYNRDFQSSIQKILFLILCVFVASSALTACRTESASTGDGHDTPQPAKTEAPSRSITNRVESEYALTLLKEIRLAQNAYFAQFPGEYGTFRQLVEHKYLGPEYAAEKPVIKGYVYTMKVA